MIDNTKVGKAISELRQKQNLTQKQLADKLDVSDKAISKWERGIGLPDISILSTLSMALDTDIESLLDGNSSYKINDWIGVLDLSECQDIINKTINNKSVLTYMFSYYLLAGISEMYIIVDKQYQKDIKQVLKNLNIKVNYIDNYSLVPNHNIMYINDSFFIYGQSLTRSYQKALDRKNGITIMSLPSHKETEDSIYFDSNRKVVTNKEDAIESAYYYNALPIIFFTKGTFNLLKKYNFKELYEQLYKSDILYTEPMFRGLIYIPLDKDNNIKDASKIAELIEKRDFEIANLEEIVLRRGLK